MQPSLFSVVKWTVTTLTRHIRETLDSDPGLQDVWVEGEISNFSRPASGHLYFSLKDSGASIRCVIWKTVAPRIGVALQDGMAVTAHGRIGIYEAAGQYQLYADQVRPAGEGALFQEFLRLKVALEVEGLFSPLRKRPIPDFPLRIGIVTSPTGAALRDVLNTIRRRLPLAQAILGAAQVQGSEAPGQLVQALLGLNRLRPRPDVILLVRGGGSMEDLWAFNDEQVVRAVCASDAPIICGVGHETDFTLADFAADLRAPTPTAAAELATPTTALDLAEKLGSVERQLAASVMAIVTHDRDVTGEAARDLRFHSPMRRIQSDLQQLDELSRRSHAAQAHNVALASGELRGLGKRLETLSPLQVLARGYAVVTRRADGVLVSRVAQALDGIRVRVSDGTFEAEVQRGGL
jgi:exodeoxyribonuclease VII large subunit